MNKDNNGALFKNNKTSEKQPDFTGTINVGGKNYQLAAWKRTSSKGTAYLSLQVSEPRKEDDLNDDIGF